MLWSADSVSHRVNLQSLNRFTTGGAVWTLRQLKKLIIPKVLVETRAELKGYWILDINQVACDRISNIVPLAKCICHIWRKFVSVVFATWFWPKTKKKHLIPIH